MEKVLVEEDQFPLARTWVNDMPLLRIAEAPADLAELALYVVVGIPALSMQAKSHLARVQACTPWCGLIVEINITWGLTPSALS